MGYEIAQEKKNEIILATLHCIKTKGYYHFSMQDVAKLSGVSKGIIHYYFLNKDHLLLSVLERIYDEKFTMYNKMVENNNNNIIKSFEKILKTCLRIIIDTKEYYSIQIDFWSRTYQKKNIEDIITQHFIKFQNLFKKILIKAHHQKTIKDIDIECYASMCLALIDGLSLQKFFTNNKDIYKKVCDESIQLILNQIKK